MSNILIIKHGSLGDIAQISGVLKDIKEHHESDKILILTTLPYVELLNNCPHVDGVIIDRRLPRWNIFYLFKLKKTLKRFNFTHVYDLQNSSRTSFYRKFLLNIKNWSSTETILEKEMEKEDFDKDSVLYRFKIQLNKSDVITKNTLKPNFSWACKDVDQLINTYVGKKFILLFPFCSPQLEHKQWPYYNEIIKIIKKEYSKFDFVVAPGPNEIDKAKKIDAILITNNQKPLDIMELAGLIKKSSFVISNDTGPAHISAHLDMSGVALFGHHTTSKKVSIETNKFRAISAKDLINLSAESVFYEIKQKLDLIN